MHITTTLCISIFSKTFLETNFALSLTHPVLLAESIQYIISAADPTGGFTSNGDVTVHFDTKSPAGAALIGHFAQWSENYYNDRYLRVYFSICVCGWN